MLSRAYFAADWHRTAPRFRKRDPRNLGLLTLLHLFATQFRTRHILVDEWRNIFLASEWRNTWTTFIHLLASSTQPYPLRSLAASTIIPLPSTLPSHYPAKKDIETTPKLFAIATLVRIKPQQIVLCCNIGCILVKH